MGGLSLWPWLIVLVVVVLVFGTRRLRNVGQDLGEAVKGFRKGMRDGDAPGDAPVDESREASDRETNATRPGDRDDGRH